MVSSEQSSSDCPKFALACRCLATVGRCKFSTRDLAVDIERLQELGVTHVVNAAKGHYIGQINTSAGYYRRAGIEFLGIPAIDSSTCNLRTYFKEAASFIESALYGRGKVYVHCECGISRAPTIVAAFLMLRRGLSARQALAAIRSKRSIYPNEGFLTQLSDLDYEHQQKGLIRPEPEMYSALDELNARYDYPLEYYHYPSLYPRTSTRFINRNFTREYSPPLTRAEIRAGIRARSEDRELPVVRYRASSLPPLSRSSTPIRDLTPYSSSKVHVYGTRTPHIPGSVIDNDIITYRPSIVAYTPRAIRGVDYDTGPVSFSTYRTSSYYKDLPSSPYESRTTSRIRYQLEPRFTSPLMNSTVPGTRFGSSTLSSPVSRYLSTPARVYISYPSRYGLSPSRSYGIYEPHLYRSSYTQHKYGLGYPTKFQTFRLIYPSIYSYHKSYLGDYY
ncbi:Dual specificity phosphatase catalytic domain [Trinorchestia longiramus]|nr:Dual specificity phosphatase catalytic domain [Trinorchestia longiramus]